MSSKARLYYQNLKRCVPVYESENLTDFFEIVYFDHRKTFDPWRCAEFVQDKNLVQSYVNIFPSAKRDMREFAMKALQFHCFFQWSDAKPVMYSEAEEREMAEIDRIFGLETVPLEDRAKESTTIFVPKTKDELDGDADTAAELMRLCGSEKLGGISLPKNQNSLIFDPAKMQARMFKIKGYTYTQWFKDEFNAELYFDNSPAGGGTNE